MKEKCMNLLVNDNNLRTKFKKTDNLWTKLYIYSY